MLTWFRRGIGSDERIGKRFLFPGIGYGGSCFPKDVQALVQSSNDVNYEFKILNAVMEINEKQKMHLIPKIKKYFGGNLKGKHFALWGLAFKPNTDDIREAPALYIIDALKKEGCYNFSVRSGSHEQCKSADRRHRKIWRESI